MGNKDTFFQRIRNIRCGDKNLDFSTVRMMGILNLTPDSFYDGGWYQNQQLCLRQAAVMLEQGADIIDMGAVSSRPGAKLVDTKEELQRLLPALKSLKKEFPEAIFSVDTFRAEIAVAAVNEGAHIINDISGGAFDKEMFATIARLNVPYVLMHMHGTPETMQKNPMDKHTVPAVIKYFQSRVKALKKMGVDDIILDPGFGFGKTMPCNYDLLKNLEALRIDSLPILAGVSRKSLVNKVLKTIPEEALNGTTVLHTLALLNGANLLRVHDVKEAKEVVKIVAYYRESTRECE